MPGPHVAPASLEIDAATGQIESVAELSEEEYRSASSGGGCDDIGDDLLSPAFVDAHVHLGLTQLRGTGVQEASRGNVVEDLFYRVESKLTAEDVRALVRMGAYEALLSGTGLVWDHYFYGEAMAEAFRDVGLCAVVGPTLEDVGGPGTGAWETQLEATERLSQRDGADGIWAALAPHATDTVSGSLWRRVADVAERLQLPVHAHLAQSVEELARVREREGTTPVELLRRSGVLDAAPASLLVHALFLTQRELEVLAKHPVTLGWCPRSQQVFAFPADPGLWERVGLPWFLATDCAASNDATSIPRELAVAAALRGEHIARKPTYRDFLAGKATGEEVWELRQQAHAANARRRDAADLLRHVWELPGALHPAFRAGVIADGALANLVLWDTGHPAFWPAEDPLRALVYSAPVPAIRQVMTAGVWRGERDDFQRSIRRSDAYLAAKEEATGRRRALLAGVV